MRDFITGLVLTGMGQGIGGSAFRGDISLSSPCFDGLVLFWLGKGVYGIDQPKAD